MLANAASLRSDSVAATLDDDALHLRRDRPNGPIWIANGLAGSRWTGRPRAVVGRHITRGGSRVRGAGQDRRRVRAVERGRQSKRSHRCREHARPRSCSPRRVARRGWRRARGSGRRALLARDPMGDRRRAVTAPTSTSARATRHLLHQREHRPAEGRGAVAPHQSVAHIMSKRPRRRRRHGLGCSASTWRAGRSPWGVARAAGQCTSCAPLMPRRCCRRAARHRAARLNCIPAVWSRILEHGGRKFDLSSLEEADTGTSATPPSSCARSGDALPTLGRVFLRIDRGRTRRAARRR